MKHIILVLICVIAASAQDKVKVESVTVYESRDTKSSPVKTLAKGAELTVDMSMTGEDGAQWCTIREIGQKQRLGYVRCDTLDRPVRAASATRPAAIPSVPSQAAGQPVFGSKGLAPKTLGETRWLGYADLIATTFQFTGPQNDQVVQLARQNGMPSCIQGTDSYPGPGLPPEMLSTSPIITCHWYAQTFYEQVFALITPEQKAARKASYETFSREVSGNRRVIEQRAKGK
jgi:hypothetical protein